MLETRVNLFEKKWVQWLAILVAIALVGTGLTALLIGQGLATLATVSYVLFGFLFMAWIFWGLWCKRDYRSVKLAGWYLATGILAVFLGTLFLLSGRIGWAISILGMWGMAVTFIVGLVLIRLLLSPGLPVFGVARTLIDEAIRMKVALVFIVGLLLLVPILPIVTSETERLQYRIQSFISWSLMATGVLLGLLTIFLSCSTIAGEISSKRIFMTMTKPLARWEFLLGKWLGIVMLNALLLTVAGVSIVAFARLLATQQETSYLDRLAVDDQVLVARTSVTPTPPAELDFAARFEQRYLQLRQEQPQRYGEKVSEKDRRAIQQSIVAAWQTIAPGQSSTFVFSGLDVAKSYSNVLQLRFKAKAAGTPPDEMVTLGFQFNDGRIEELRVADDSFQVQPLSVQAINPQGMIKLTVHNLAPSPENGGLSVSFPPGDGMQIFYRVGSFEGNLARGLFITLTKLSFVAMLGLAAGTFLSFPVAVLLTLLVYCTAGASEFLSESLLYYAGYSNASGMWDQTVLIGQAFWDNLSNHKYYDLVKLIIRIFGECFVAITPSFSRYQTIVDLADGRVITWSLTFESFWRIGLLGTGLCGAIGLAIFQKRELARVTV